MAGDVFQVSGRQGEGRNEAEESALLRGCTLSSIKAWSLFPVSMVSTYIVGDLEQLGALDLHSGFEVLDGLEGLDGLKMLDGFEVSDQLFPNGLTDPLGIELLECRE